MIENLDVDRLVGMSQPELDEVFRSSPAGDIPTGEADGTVLVARGETLSDIAAKLVHYVAWQGKVFDPDKGKLLNRVSPLGIQAVRAKVYKGASWLDGAECIVLDYSETSLIAHWIRDEPRGRPRPVPRTGVLGPRPCPQLRPTAPRVAAVGPDEVTSVADVSARRAYGEERDAGEVAMRKAHATLVAYAKVSIQGCLEIRKVLQMSAMELTLSLESLGNLHLAPTQVPWVVPWPVLVQR